MADLTTTLSESVVLNGSVRGSTNILTTTGINNVYERIVTCTIDETTHLATFNSDSFGSAVQIDKQDVRYIRITNLDATNALELAVVGAATLYQIELAAGESHILGNPDAVMLSEADTSPSFGTMADIASLQVNPAGNAIDVEVFIASI